MSTRSPFTRILHGGDYNPDQWLWHPEILREDLRLMKASGCQTFSLGIFAWTQLEPEEGRYTFDWLDRLFDAFQNHDLRVILATPSGAKPFWLSDRYPEVRRVNRQGLRDPSGGRHNHCWTSPVFRNKVRALNTALAERFGQHPALVLWHISNEYGGECLCDLCLDAFRSWLRQRYGSLDALNDAYWSSFWSHTFTDWSQIHPKGNVLDGLALDWMRFVSWQAADFYDWEVEPLRRLTPEIPCTINMMGFYEGINYWDFVGRVDLIADDNYPCLNRDNPHLWRDAAAVGMVHDLHRTMARNGPWMLMECCPSAVQWRQPMKLKHPGQHSCEMVQALSHGAEGTLYFQWRKGRGGMEKLHGAVVDHVGHDRTRVFQEVAALSRLYEAVPDLPGTRCAASVGLIYDWEARWAFRLSHGTFHQPPQDQYLQVAQSWYRALWQRGLLADILSSEQPFLGLKLLIVPQLILLRPGVASALRRFVEQGGSLLATYYTGMVDASNRCWLGGSPGDNLQTLFGIWVEEIDCLHPSEVRRLAPTDHTSFPCPDAPTARSICELIHTPDAQPLLVYDDAFYKGRAALTVNSVGSGKAYYLATQVDEPVLDAILGHLLQEQGLAPAWTLERPAPVRIERRSDAGRTFWFVTNFSADPQTLDLGSHRFRAAGDGAAWSGSRTLAPFESAILTPISEQPSR